MNRRKTEAVTETAAAIIVSVDRPGTDDATQEWAAEEARRISQSARDKIAAAARFPHKADERALLVSLGRHCGDRASRAPMVRDVLEELHQRRILHYRRAVHILYKFTGGFYNYGVAVDCGWLEEAGRDRAAALESEAVVEGYNALYAFLRPGSYEAQCEGCCCDPKTNRDGEGISYEHTRGMKPRYIGAPYEEHARCPIHGLKAEESMRRVGIVMSPAPKRYRLL